MWVAAGWGSRGGGAGAGGGGVGQREGGWAEVLGIDAPGDPLASSRLIQLASEPELLKAKVAPTPTP